MDALSQRSQSLTLDFIWSIGAAMADVLAVATSDHKNDSGA